MRHSAAAVACLVGKRGQQRTDTEGGAESVHSISELLRTNTTLQSLHLNSEHPTRHAQRAHPSAVPPRDRGRQRDGATPCPRGVRCSGTKRLAHRAAPHVFVAQQRSTPLQQAQRSAAQTELCKAVNSIEEAGAAQIAKLLAANSTLAVVNLRGLAKDAQRNTVPAGNDRRAPTGNDIELRGTKALSEALATNTALISLDLGCQSRREDHATEPSATAPRGNKAQTTRSARQRQLCSHRHSRKTRHCRS